MCVACCVVWFPHSTRRCLVLCYALQRVWLDAASFIHCLAPMGPVQCGMTCNCTQFCESECGRLVHCDHWHCHLPAI